MVLESQLILLAANDQLVLSWWSCQSNVMVGKTLVPFMSDLTIFTDVSFEGWEPTPTLQQPQADGLHSGGPLP